MNSKPVKGSWLQSTDAVVTLGGGPMPDSGHLSAEILLILMMIWYV